jgi:hypothetical protein
MRGHFPNNPRPPLVLAFGFTHPCFYLRQSAKTRYAQTLAAFLPEIKQAFVTTTWGSGTENPNLGKNLKVPLCKAESRKSYLE